MRLCLMALVVLSLVSQAMAGPIFLNAERFGYSGSWNRYGSLADAQAGVNSIESGLVPQRDLSIYISQGVTDNPFDPLFAVLTNWYSGAGNPSNTNFGFLQYYDADASTVQSLEAGFSSDLSEFSLSAKAGGADYANDFTRFGERPGGPGSATEAFFHSLNLDLLISGLTGSYNPATMRYEVTDASGSTISGSLTGIVQNVGSDPSRHGFYTYDLTLNNNSWSFDNGHVGVGDLSAFSTQVAPVPEPASWIIMALALPIGLMARRRLRHK